MPKNFYLFFYAFLFLTFSCKKNPEKTPLPKEETLPNFSHIEVEKILNNEDSTLKNEQEIKNKLQTYYDTTWVRNNFWGGFLVAKGNNILIEKYRGCYQNRASITENTPIHIASISKPMTAMAILKLTEAGKISLSDSLTKFFPQFPYPDITLKELLNHRSGLARYEYFLEKIPQNSPEMSKNFLTNDDILQLFNRHKPELSRKPNTGFMYCNTNYALLALVVEKVTKKKFPIAMQEILFQPLGMKNTFIPTNEKEINTAVSSFYQSEKPHPLNHLDLIYGDKNVFSTPKDLLNFSKAMFAKNFLKKELMQQVFTPYSNEKKGINNYGLGFRMKVFNNDKKLPYHTGWWHGNNTIFIHLPESKTTIIALGNKFTRQIYSAMDLAVLFEDFPIQKNLESAEIDSTQKNNRKNSLSHHKKKTDSLHIQS